MAKAEGDPSNPAISSQKLKLIKPPWSLGIEEGVLGKIIQPEGSEGIPVNEPIAVP